MRHPDEGEIHAWLDGALDPATAAGFEAHVAACPACAAAVAEARGLIAGASRILLALDGVPSGVIPAPLARRHAPWYARRPVQIAAGLMLVAGVGGIVARNGDRSADQVSIQFETDMSPANKGPAVGPTAAAAKKAEAVVAESPPADLAAIVPPTPAPQTPSPAADQSPRRAELGAVGAGAGVARANVVEQRQRSSVAEQLTPAPPPSAAPAVVNAPLAVAPLTTPPVLMDSLANSLAAGRLDAPRRRALTSEPSAQLGGVVVTDASAKLATVGGACFTLNVDDGGDVAGIPLLPRRVRFRMADAPNVSESRLRRLEAKSARADAAAPAAAAAPGFGGTPSEPARPLPWQPVAADSVDVTWVTETDVITLRLQIRGNNVSGTATSDQGTPRRTAKVDGLKVACGGGD